MVVGVDPPMAKITLEVTVPPWKTVVAPFTPVVTDTLTDADGTVALRTSVTVAVCAGGVLVGATEIVLAVYPAPEQVPGVTEAVPGPKQK